MSKQHQQRIGIDGFNLSLEKGTGVATYARTLSRALSSLGYTTDILYGLRMPNYSNIDLREVRFFDCLSSSDSIKSKKNLLKNWIQERKEDFTKIDPIEIIITNKVDYRSLLIHIPEFNRIFNVNNIFNKAYRHFRKTGNFTKIHMNSPPDIMHWTYPLPIEIVGSKNIYTLHDLVPLKLPHTTNDDKPYYFNLLKKISILSDGICTVSEASRHDILSFFPEMSSKLYNTYQSRDINKFSHHRSDDDCRIEIETKFNLKIQEYFLFFGSLEPKKNIGRIIEAFLASFSNKKLVIVGAMSWKSEKELRYLDHGISTGKIIKVEYLPENTLFSLLRHARALLFPSLSEGFGLPVLESMNCGTPVLISKEGSLPEIGGNAVLSAEAYDVDSITSAIRRLDRDDNLCQILRNAGYEQAEKFSMVAYQKRLREMYTAVLCDSRKT